MGQGSITTTTKAVSQANASTKSPNNSTSVPTQRKESDIHVTLEVEKGKILLVDAGIWSTDNRTFVAISRDCVVRGKLVSSANASEQSKCVDASERLSNDGLDAIQKTLDEANKNLRKMGFLAIIEMVSILQGFYGDGPDKERHYVTDPGDIFLFIPDLHIGLKNAADDFWYNPKDNTKCDYMDVLITFLEGVGEKVCKVQLGDFIDLWEVEGILAGLESITSRRERTVEITTLSDISWVTLPCDTCSFWKYADELLAFLDGKSLNPVPRVRWLTYRSGIVGPPFNGLAGAKTMCYWRECDPRSKSIPDFLESTTAERNGFTYTERAQKAVERVWGDKLERLLSLFSVVVPGNHDMTFGTSRAGEGEESVRIWPRNLVARLGKDGRILALHGHTASPFNSVLPGKEVRSLLSPSSNLVEDLVISAISTDIPWHYGKKKTWECVWKELMSNPDWEKSGIIGFFAGRDGMLSREVLENSVVSMIKNKKNDPKQVLIRVVVYAHTHLDDAKRAFTLIDV